MNDRAGAKPVYRYGVVSTWGRVPSGVIALVGSQNSYLVYPDYLGLWKRETWADLKDGRVLGGWRMTYVGKRPDDPATPTEAAA